MTEFLRSKVAESGRVIIPAALRREFDLNDGTDLVFCRGQFGIEMLTVAQAVNKAQEAVRKYVPGDNVDLTAELLASRQNDGSLR
jgi:bifunctional DNA-binding transcriptional regulator/antitoxin component of YhaV-PrlF toxin-antitoxin module